MCWAALGVIDHLRRTEGEQSEFARRIRGAAPEHELEERRGRARGDFQHDASALGDLEFHARGRAAEADNSDETVRLECGAGAVGFSGGTLDFAHGHRERGFGGFDFERADETRFPIALDAAGLLENFRAVNRVGEHDVGADRVIAIPAAPRARQRAERLGARIFERAVLVRPAGHLAQPELLVARDFGMPAVRAIKSHALGADKARDRRAALALRRAAGPARGHPQQIRVETHERLVAENHREAFVRLVVRGKFRADARFLKREIRLNQIRLGFLPRFFRGLGGIRRKCAETGESEDCRRGELRGASARNAAAR